MRAQQSDPGSRATLSACTGADTSPGSDQMSGAGEREPAQLPIARDLRHDPAPDLKSPPTPEQEASPTEADRSGVGGANHQSTQPDAAGLPPSGVPGVPDPSPPDGSGTTNRAGRGSGVSGDAPSSAPAGTLFELAPQWDHGRFTR